MNKPLSEISINHPKIANCSFAALALTNPFIAARLRVPSKVTSTSKIGTTYGKSIMDKAQAKRTRKVIAELKAKGHNIV